MQQEVETQWPSSGSLALRVSNALGRLHKEFVGRGPTKVRTYIEEDLIVCVLEGGFTRAERTVRQYSGDEPVIEARLRLQAAMRPAMLDAVQTIVGREVRSFMSANDPSEDLQVEVMLLRPGQTARALP
jgi:uncharacterized protein YbcI